MYTVIDIETTGFLKYDSNHTLITDLLEFGYIQLDDKLRIVNHGTLYFYEPHFDIENDAQRIHGLTRQFLEAHATDNYTNATAMAAMLTNTIIIGKNTDGFDIPFIKAWLKKMYGYNLDIGYTTEVLGMKGYHGGYVFHRDNSLSLDLQKCYKPYWQQAMREQGFAIGNKKGSLSQYVEAIPGGFDMVKEIYGGLTKDRETLAHGALYDCVMTYLVLVQYIIKNGGI